MSFAWLKKVAELAPLVLPLIPGLPPVLTPFIVKGIATAETFQGATGAEKLAKAVDEVNNGIAAVNAVHPGAVNAGAVNDAVVHGISTVVAIANVAHPKTADGPSAPKA